MIPFNVTTHVPKEIQYVTDVLQSRRDPIGNGYYGQLCEKHLGAIYGSKVLLVSSATHALEMMGLLLNLAAGDEVIVPSFTFVSTANAFALRGATVVFADCDSYGNLCLASVKSKVTDKTRAICVVHYAGNSPDMDLFVNFCAERKIYLLEDAAQSIDAHYKDIPLGSHGRLACLSFHGSKNISSGEGGALIVNDPSLFDRAEVIREKGTNRRQFLMGIVDKYSWSDLGSSYIMSDLNAAVLYGQLNEVQSIQTRRRMLWSRYAKAFSQRSTQISYLIPPKWNDGNAHMFALFLSSQTERDKFISHMRESQISTPFHYVALHESNYARQHLKATTNELPMTSKFSSCLVRLPMFDSMTVEQQDEVIACVLRFENIAAT